MNSAETLNVLIAHDVYLEPDETITWIGRPAKQAFVIENCRSLIKWPLFVAGFYLFSHLPAVNHQAGSTATSLFLFVSIIAVVNIRKAIKNIRGHNQIIYVITSHRIVISRKFSFLRVVYIPANELLQVTLRQSPTDQDYGTACIELDSGKTQRSDGDDVKVYDYCYAVPDPHIPLQLLEDIITANKQRAK